MPTPSPDAAVVDRHASLSGRVSGHDLIVLGSLEGELQLTGRLHTAAGSRLRARVQADVVEIEGEFDGEVRAATLRVSASARARGVFVAERLSIQEGALLEGDVQAPASPAVAPVGAAPVNAPAAAEDADDPAGESAGDGASSTAPPPA